MTFQKRAHSNFLRHDLGDDAALRRIIERLMAHLTLLYGPAIPPAKGCQWFVEPSRFGADHVMIAVVAP